MTLECCEQSKWPQVASIVTTTLQGATIRDIEVTRSEVGADHPTPTGRARALGPAQALQAASLDSLDAWEDQGPLDHEEFYDDVSGEMLPPDLTREARLEEIRFMQDWKVWEVRTIQECKEVTGKAPYWREMGRPQQRGCRLA